ncbi:MAG: hypothetical protein JWO89_2292 [Verrucomicrobiaceae bacterium]|nr:hypothetical protein [Verrucomicrobiaceae bacterium]
MSPSPHASGMAAAAPRENRGVGRLLIWAALCFAVPAVLPRVVKPKKEPVAASAQRSTVAMEVRDVPKTIAELQAANPDYIAIGNSMLYTRLGKTPEKMNALTGKKFFFIVRNGSSSAAWYLSLKNIVVASGVKPKLVFFFIRDNDITSPFFRTAGDYAVYLNSLRGPEEPVLDAILGKAPQRQGAAGSLGRLLNGPGGLYHFPDWDEKLPRQVIDLAMDIGAVGTPKTALRSTLSSRFALEHLRPDLGADTPAPGSGDGYAPDGYSDLIGNYQEAEERSFLPAMMQTAKEHGLKLLFFRIKRRPDNKGVVSDESPALREYARHLQKWIEEHGGLFFDETYDTSIPASIYQDGDHVGEKHMDWYRASFWKRTAGLFP